MTEPVPTRVVEMREEVRPDGTVVRAARVVEYGRPGPPGPPALPPAPPDSGGGPSGYDPERDSPAAGGPLQLDAAAPARAALPPGPPTPARRRWRR